MAIETNCPGCQTKLAVPDEYAGQSAQCPVCAAVYVVGERNEPDVASVETSESPVEQSLTEPSLTDDFSANDSPIATSVDAPPVDEKNVPDRNDTIAPPSSPQFVDNTDNSQWWLRTPEGQTFGPVARDQLHNWVAQGRVSCDCQIRVDDEPDWRKADYFYPILNWMQLQIYNAEMARRQPRRDFGSALNSLMTTDESRDDEPTPNIPTAHPEIASHRAGLILTLAILAFPTICPVFSILAWVMGRRDLKEMQAGRMNREGWDLTQAGRILGVLFTVLWPAIAAAAVYFLVNSWAVF